MAAIPAKEPITDLVARCMECSLSADVVVAHPI